jgi:hypothetical protein
MSRRVRSNADRRSWPTRETTNHVEIAMPLRMFLVVTVALATLSGCSQKSAAPTAPAPTPTSLVLTPADGASAVRLDAPVTLEFGVAVDRAVVERGFHLISEYDMTSAPCPDSLMALHGTMMTVMADSAMTRHMDQFHSTSGSLAWDAASTMCTFQPTSWMRPQTRYMLHLDRDMAQMMTARMGAMGGMAGHGSGQTMGDMMFHFTTLDTTGGGHNGHH